MTKEIISKMRVTEKGAFLAEKNVYVFNVDEKANKTELTKAILKLYKVTPIKINIVTVPKKNKSFRGKVTAKKGGKKAFVYLKKGDKIEFV